MIGADFAQYTGFKMDTIFFYFQIQSNLIFMFFLAEMLDGFLAEMFNMPGKCIKIEKDTLLSVKFGSTNII